MRGSPDPARCCDRRSQSPPCEETFGRKRGTVGSPCHNVESSALAHLAQMQPLTTAARRGLLRRIRGPRPRSVREEHEPVEAGAAGQAVGGEIVEDRRVVERRRLLIAQVREPIGVVVGELQRSKIEANRFGSYSQAVTSEAISRLRPWRLPDRGRCRAADRRPDRRRASRGAPEPCRVSLPAPPTSTLAPAPATRVVARLTEQHGGVRQRR